MENDYHWRWWHWLILIAVIVLCLGVGYTWINNYKIVKRGNQSISNGTQQVIEHPIDSTKNAVNDMTY